ncbi:hypothetical protein E8E12_008093 [Didymella heteroderae]|uniref:NAD-dependent epimerase/dehydratase domain-containing protein n=1 Tax=Didymella heteroderae TaxID=1769908 RepID=A0A9P4WN69_9PLEO|nr:hypothetical protein E8E12_008093 [Didymella heteroderae]
MGKAIFITGGSGYIGRTLIALALSRGYTVTALSRTPSSDTTLSSLGARPIRGDLSTLSILTERAAQADIVISIADALASDHSMSRTERFRINDAANNALAEGLKGTGKALVLTGGSLHAAALPNHELTDESSPGWPEGHWAAFNLGGIQQRWLDMGVRVCQVRLAPYVYGRGGSGVGLFMKMWAQAGQGMVVDGGAMCTTTVHVDDAVRLYLLVAEKGRKGESYNATAETNITQAHLAQAICRVIDVPCKELSLDKAALKVGPFLAGFLSAENRASNRKAREELGWEVRGVGILRDIENGSYVEVAKALKDGRGA